MTHQASAYWDQNAVPEESQHVTLVSPRPTWEAYFKYAEQLNAAGRRRDAEAYYRQARLLYEQTKAPQAPRRTSRGTYSYTPPQPYQSATDLQSPFIGKQPITAEVSAYPVRSSAPQTRRKKISVKRWALIGLTTGLAVVVVGVIALFVYYNSHVKNVSENHIDRSFMGRVRAATLDPMAFALKPAFDKANRIWAASQPLFFELNLRDTLPANNLYADRSDNTLQAAVVAVNDVSKPAPESVATVADVESETPADSSAPDSSENEKQVIESDVEVRDYSNVLDEESDEKESSRSSRRSRRRSRRHRHSNESETTTPQATSSHVETAAPPPASQAQEPAAFASAPAPAPPAPKPDPLIDNAVSNRRSSKTADLDNLLNPRAKPAPKKPSSQTAAGPAQKMTLSRADVQSGMMRVSNAVKQCGRGMRGTITMSIVIGTNGRVSRAQPTGVYAGTAIGACAARAVRNARFPAAQQSLTVKYPFTL